MYCLYASLLMMVLLAGVVDCSANGKQFEKDTSLADKVCPVERRVFEQQTVSKVACMAVASLAADCIKAFGYNEEQHMCYGCDTTAGEFQTLEGTVFYSRAYPDGFEDINGYMLKVVTTPGLTYDEAHDECAAQSASLVRIDSPEKQSAVRCLLNGDFYWIQCRYDTYDGVWKFDDGAPVPMTNDFWDAINPSTANGYICTYMVESLSYYWRSDTCAHSHGYICELK